VVGEVGQGHFFWSVHDAVLYYYSTVLHEDPPNIEEEHAQHHAHALAHAQAHADKTHADPSRAHLLEGEAKEEEEGHEGEGVGEAVAEGDDSYDYSPFIFEMHETNQR
jgi:hypothetical protein